jgi:hypothetical protein
MQANGRALDEDITREQFNALLGAQGGRAEGPFGDSGEWDRFRDWQRGGGGPLSLECLRGWRKMRQNKMKKRHPPTYNTTYNTKTARCWYFSFGGNMSARTLARRAVFPQRSVAGRLVGYRLVFSYDGYAGVEPRFANVEPIGKGAASAVGGVVVARAGGDEDVGVCHGVAHLITEEEVRRLDEYEGEGYAYQRVVVPMRPYEKDKHTVLEYTQAGEKTEQFQVQAASTNAVGDDDDDDATIIRAYVYVAMASHRVAPGLPSCRYLKLLVDGAEANGLNPAYIEALRARPSYDWSGTSFPVAPMDAPTLAWEVIAKHEFRPPGPSLDRTRTTECNDRAAMVWVHIGGLVFDVSEKVESRAMLRNMSGAIGGTRFVLKMWNAAFGSPFLNEDDGAAMMPSLLKKRKPAFNARPQIEALGRLDGGDFEEDVRLDTLKPEVRDYVASWAQNMVAQNCPCVGVSRHHHQASETASSVVSAAAAAAAAPALPAFSANAMAAIQAAAQAASASTPFDVRIYYFEIGLILPMTLTVRVRTRKDDAAWWLANEDALLRELSAGISANADALFDNVHVAGNWKHCYNGASEEATTYVPLKTIAFRYSISELTETGTERRTMGVRHVASSIVDLSAPTVTMVKEVRGKKRRRKHSPDAEVVASTPMLSRRVVVPFMMTCTVLRIAKTY